MRARIIICLGVIAVLLWVKPDFGEPASVLYREVSYLRASLMQMLFALAQLALFVFLLAYLVWPVLQDLSALLKHRRERGSSLAEQRLRQAVADRKSPLLPGEGE
jgi:hypothetical protein